MIAGPRFRVPCCGLSRDCGGRQGADSNIVAAVAPIVEGSGIVPAIAVVGPRIHLILLVPYSYWGYAKFLAEAAPAIGREAAGMPYQQGTCMQQGAL